MSKIDLSRSAWVCKKWLDQSRALVSVMGVSEWPKTLGLEDPGKMIGQTASWDAR